jgi:DNA-binding transcriptional ArsR family regulator
MPNENHQYDAPPGVEPSELADETAAVDPDELLSALNDPMRRRLVWYLVDRDGCGTTVEEVTDVLLGWQTTESAVVGPEERDKVSLALRHVHLPKLSDCDLIDYDPGSGLIRLRPLSAPVIDLVRSAYRYDRVMAAGEE